MESKRTHDELKEILDRNTAWIENCDSKTSIILGSFGVIAGIFLATDYVSKFKSILCHMASRVSFWTVVYVIFCILSISLILTGCVCWLTVLFARVNPDKFYNRGIKSDSLIFFSSIAKHKSLSSYKRDLEKCGTKVGIVSCFNRFDLICSINFNWFIDYMKYTFWSEMVGFELEQYLGKYN